MEEAKKELKFREDELVRRKFYDRRTGRDIEVVFPKVSGRLRLAHEDNEKLAIYSEIIEHTPEVATVSTKVITDKGEFVGLSSVVKEQAQHLSGAMLEFAQTKSLSRALRWAGYGMEYAGAEEVMEGGAEARGTTPLCTDCGKPIQPAKGKTPDEVAQVTLELFGDQLCYECSQKRRAEQM